MLVNELHDPNRGLVGVEQVDAVAIAAWAVFGVAVFAAVYCN